MWRQRAHAHLSVLAGLASFCLCTSRAFDFTAPHTVDSPVDLSDAVHSNNLSTPSSESTLFPVPNVPYHRGQILAVAVVSALVFLLFSCSLLLGSFRNSNGRGSIRSLSERHPGHPCYDDSQLDFILTGPLDRRALEEARQILTALDLPPSAMQTLKTSERELLSSAQSAMRSHTERLAFVVQSISVRPAAQLPGLIAEREKIRSFMGSIKWSPAQEAEALFCRARAFSLGRRMPREVAVALVAAELVKSPNKPTSTTATREQQRLVEQMVESMRVDIDHFAHVLVNTRGIPSQEVDAARDMLEESECLWNQLRYASMHALSESLNSSCRGLRDALKRRTGRKPSRTASLPSMLSRMAIRGPSPAPKGTQAPRHYTPSVSSLDPEQPRGAEGTASAEQLGARPKTTTASGTLWSSLRRQRRGTVTEDSASPAPTSPQRRLPVIPETGSQVRPISVQEVPNLTASMKRWATRCTDSLKSLRSTSAREASLDGVAAEGMQLYREVTSVSMDSSVDHESSQSFTDALKLLKSLLNKVHAELIVSWLGRVAESRQALTKARYGLQMSVNEVNDNTPPRAGGPYIGDVTVLRATLSAGRRTSESLRRFLGVRSTHQRLSDALEGLESVLTKGEQELQSAISLAADMWRRRLEDAEGDKQASSAVRISPVKSGTLEAAPSKAVLIERAKTTAQFAAYRIIKYFIDRSKTPK
ncbi:uncharacterized protein EMH_0039860 [Eimeria mitis]|uniref:Transmembrane protein n=1 Tax=Eimeria mitis TaxID=44415 RepID=U6KKC0_9EIME|nr:uncharacterized protein EMH_0039860 [Eimeria mitis]CDJ35883.1 hypothetical protein, conserved [Eimeria mitis]